MKNDFLIFLVKTSLHLFGYIGRKQLIVSAIIFYFLSVRLQSRKLVSCLVFLGTARAESYPLFVWFLPTNFLQASKPWSSRPSVLLPFLLLPCSTLELSTKRVSVGQMLSCGQSSGLKLLWAPVLRSLLTCRLRRALSLTLPSTLPSSRPRFLLYQPPQNSGVSTHCNVTTYGSSSSSVTT